MSMTTSRRTLPLHADVLLIKHMTSSTHTYTLLSRLNRVLAFNHKDAFLQCTLMAADGKTHLQWHCKFIRKHDDTRRKVSAAKQLGSMEEVLLAKQEDRMGRVIEDGTLHNLFMPRSVYKTLHSPSNVHQCHLIEEPSCQLCGEQDKAINVVTGQLPMEV